MPLGTRVSVCRRNAGDRRAGELEERLAGRGPQVQEEDIGGRMRRPQPHVAVPGRALEPRLEQLAAQQPGDPAVLEVDDTVLVPDVTEGDPDGEGSAPS